MKSFSTLYEQLDKLKAGTLPTEEKTALMQKYHADADFRKEVHFYLAAQQAIIADFEREMAKVNRADMNRWYQEAKSKRSFYKKIAYSTIAASFLIILLTIWYLYPTPQNCTDNITQKYAVTLNINAQTMGVNTPKPLENEKLTQLSEFYQQGNYAKVIQLANTLPNSATNKVVLYQALSELQLQQTDTALKHLEMYQQQLTPEDNLKSSIYWWKLMAYYQKGDKTNALMLANQIIAKHLTHQKEAKELIPCLK